MIRSVGVVGYGAFGRFVRVSIERFAPSIKVRTFSSKEASDGENFFSLKEVAKCDAVILCVPIHAYEETLEKLVPLARPDTIVVDVATVKTYTLDLLKKYASGRPYISTHPMFGPESYEKRGGDVSGFRIVICEHTLSNPLFSKFTDLLRGMGFDVVEMSADSHDKHLAETLFLTHFIGQVISRADFARTEIDTVSFGYLMNAVESVKHDTALFKDVYRFNPYCKEVLDRLNIAEEEVRALLETK